MKRRGLFRHVVLWVLVLFLGTACHHTVMSELKGFKGASEKGDYAWIAQQDVSCKSSNKGCNQVHLIKGDACFRLAKANQDPKKHYDCARAHLESGIAQTKEWQVGDLNLDRTQTYTNLLEAIRNLQDMEKGAKAEELTKKLLQTAQAFEQIEPGNSVAVYFLNSARYTLLRTCILHPERCPSLCKDMKDIRRELERAEPKAEGTTLEANYDRLIKDIRGAEQLTCP